MHDARREGVFSLGEFCEGLEESADADVLIWLLRPEDHPKGSQFLQPPVADLETVGVRGDQGAPLLDGPDQDRLVDRALAEDVDRPDDVPTLVSEALDERASN